MRCERQPLGLGPSPLPRLHHRINRSHDEAGVLLRLRSGATPALMLWRVTSSPLGIGLVPRLSSVPGSSFSLSLEDSELQLQGDNGW